MGIISFMAQQTQQSLSNHTRLDPLFHFVLLPLTLVLIAISIYALTIELSTRSIWMLLVSIAIFICAFKLRSYPLKAQDRVIRLEERLRMQNVLPDSQKNQIAALTEGQFIALRFAPDSELPGLVNDAVTKKLAPKEIKQSIKHWRPDFFRI
jgi:hypothetical protein